MEIKNLNFFNSVGCLGLYVFPVLSLIYLLHNHSDIRDTTVCCGHTMVETLVLAFTMRVNMSLFLESGINYLAVDLFPDKMSW